MSKPSAGTCLWPSLADHLIERLNEIHLTARGYAKLAPKWKAVLEAQL